MRVVALSIGRPTLRVRDGRPYSTAIDRRPVDTPVEVGMDGFVGDRVSDLHSHGGPDKAVCCYPAEHYPAWRERLSAAMAMPSFGENLTTEGLLEDAVCIGDTLRIGAVTVQVSQPRQPCWKLAEKHGAPELPRWVEQSGWTGFYVRVIEPGKIGAGDRITLLARPHPEVTIRMIDRIRQTKGAACDGAVLRRLAELPALSASWRRRMAQMLSPDGDAREE